MTPTETVLSALSDLGCEPRPCGGSYKARCPAHDDGNPSLSVSTSEDGKCLVCCHAGCSHAQIVSELGLEQADLFPGDGHAGHLRARYTKPAALDTRRRYATAREAAESLTRSLGQWDHKWHYDDADGYATGLVLRWDSPTGKEIRPISLVEGGWVIGAHADPRPLWNLPDLSDAKQVFLCEGEPAASCAFEMGLHATTSQGGSKAASHSDWSPLAGKEVVILPDNDHAGEAYAADVIACLSCLSPAPTVKIVRLPGLPDKGDLVDFIEANVGRGLAEIERTIREAVNAAEHVNIDGFDVEDTGGGKVGIGSFVSTKLSGDLEYSPFPVSELPFGFRSFVDAAAKAIGCDQSYVALPLLSGLAASIGTSCRIQIKHDWSEPAIVWTAIVGESGTSKSPAIEAALRPVRAHQRDAFAEHAELKDEFDETLLRYDRDLAGWKKSGCTGPAPEAPEEPTPDRFWIDDATTESLLKLLQENPRGLLMVRDELAGWFAGFDRYAASKGGDASRWIEMFGARPIVVDRKGVGSLYVHSAAVSVCGGIQPSILKRSLSQEHRDSGLAARLLLAYPPRTPKRWTEDSITPEIERTVSQAFSRLYGIDPDCDHEGRDKPHLIPLSTDGKREWIEFFNQHAEQQARLSGDEAAAFAKLEGYAARFALIIHLSKWALGEDEVPTPLTPISASSIRAGVTITRWFGNEAQRVYAMLSESKKDAELRSLVEVVSKAGGSMSGRELMQARRGFQTVQEAETCLHSIVEHGWGVWITPKREGTGRPKARRVLINAVYKTTKPHSDTARGGFVDGVPVSSPSLTASGEAKEAG